MKHKLASVQVLRKLAANDLRKHRAFHSMGDEYSSALRYGSYLAYKSAAWRVDFDNLTHKGKKNK